jgi:hypothetical protein
MKHAFGTTMPAPDRKILVTYMTDDEDRTYVHFEIGCFRSRAFGLEFFRQSPNDGYGKPIDQETALDMAHTGYWEYLTDVARNCEMLIPTNSAVDGDEAGILIYDTPPV